MERELSSRALMFILHTALEEYASTHPGFARKVRRRMEQRLSAAQTTPIRGLRPDEDLIAELRAALEQVKEIDRASSTESRRRA